MVLPNEAGVGSQELGGVVDVKLERCHGHSLSSELWSRPVPFRGVTSEV